MDVEPPGDDLPTDLLCAIQVEVEDVVDHHELAHAVGSDEILHLIDDFRRGQPAVLFTVNRVAVRAAVGTATAGHELHRPGRLREVPGGIEPEVGIQVEQVEGRRRKLLHGGHVCGNILADASVLDLPHTVNAVGTLAGF